MPLRRHRTSMRHGPGRVALASITLLLSLGTGAVLSGGEQQPINVGGQTLTLRSSLILRVPEGWHRAAAKVEAEEDAFVFYYTGRDFDPDRDLPHGIVQINREPTDFDTAGEIDSFDRNLESRLTGGGWTRGEITVGAAACPCYTLNDGDSTTFLVQLRFNLRLIHAYAILPKTGAGFPRYALRLLEGLTSGAK